MKIGILTIHETLNYGSSLQTYGLYYGLVKLGCDCEVIDYRCETIYQKEFFAPKVIKYSLRKIIATIYISIFKQIKKKEFVRFNKDYIKLSSKRYTKDTIKHANKYYDKFIVGSDMVWGLDITGNDFTYFLDFVDDNNKKYAFSSSVGEFWKKEDLENVKKYLSEFNFISVRENRAADWIENLINKDVIHTQDPTILVERENWYKLARNIHAKEKYVLIYYPDKKGKIFDDAIRYAKKNKCRVYFINFGLARKGIRNIFAKSVEEFLGLILNAEAVFTSSYHGMLFSVYFNKEFWIYNDSHKSRMESVMKSLNIENRDLAQEVNYEKKLDYIAINKRLDSLREEAYDVLKNKIL